MLDFDTTYSFFSFFPIIFMVLFVLVIGIFLATAIKGIRTWNQNNNSPKLTVEATVASKRTDVSHHHTNHGTDHMGSSMSHTTYFATFQFDSGDRLELTLPASEAGYLAEGDRGKLSFQGTRFLSFERTR